jgi:hypothetical protein
LRGLSKRLHLHTLKAAGSFGALPLFPFERQFRREQKDTVMSKFLFDKILKSAQPRAPQPAQMTPNEMAAIDSLIEAAIDAALDTLRPEVNRSTYEFPKGTFDAIEYSITCELFPDKDALQRVALKYLKEKTSEYCRVIKLSERLMLLKQSAERLKAAVSNSDQTPDSN